MKAQEIQERDRQYVANTYARFDLVLERGKGATLYDVQGKAYIDLGSGIGVNSLGYGDEGWVRAVTKQAGKLAHTSNLYYTEPCGKLAELICQRTGMDKVFFANSGAEANEGAIKCARKAAKEKHPERSVILSLKNSFHGRTLATLSATGQESFHQHFGPFPAGFRYAPANDFEGTVEQLKEDVCAVMVELIQGEGGVMPLDVGYVQAVERLCKERGILLIVDEVQTGVGRTGKFLCCEHYHLHPDIVTLAKGLGGGLPIGAVVMDKTCSFALGAGDHGSTFGGNPIACAGGIEVVERLDDALLDAVTEKGNYLRETLGKLTNVQSVDGIGMMLGIELREGIAAKEVVTRAIEKGVIPLTAKNKVRLLPPLVISWKELEEAAVILGECIQSF